MLYDKRLEESKIEIFSTVKFDENNSKLEKGYYWVHIGDNQPNGPYETYSDCAKSALELVNI